MKYKFIITLCFFSGILSAQKKYAPEALIVDLDTLYHQLLETHPEPGAYISLNDLESAYQNLRSGLTDSLTQRDFYTRIAPFYVSIKDAHGTIAMPDLQLNDMVKSEAFYLPIKVKLLDDGVFVLEDKDSLIEKGSKLLSVNGFDINEIVSTMLQSMPSDGNISTLKRSFFEARFSSYLPVFFPIDSLNTLSFLLPEPDSVVVLNYTGEKFQMPGKQKRKDRKRKNEDVFSFEVNDSLSMGVMKIASFSSSISYLKYSRFLKNTFKEIEAKNIQNLVIDIRGNSGGNPDRGIKLMEYFSKGKIQVYHQNITRASKMCKQHLNDIIFLPKLMLLFFGKKTSSEIRTAFKAPEGQYDTIYYDVHTKVARKHHFDGDVFLLVDGMSASASGLLTNAIAKEKLATIIGEETGCTTNGCFGQAAWFVLPHTKIKARISLFRFMSSDRFEYDDRGYIPKQKHNVPVRLDDVIGGRDTQLEFVKELIRSLGDGADF